MNKENVYWLDRVCLSLYNDASCQFGAVTLSSRLSVQTVFMMVDNHRLTVLVDGVRGDNSTFDSLTDSDSYPFGIYHHKSNLLVSYNKKDNFPRLDLRLILLEDEKAYRTRCGFSVKLQAVPDLIEILLAMLRAVDPGAQYPVRYFENHPIGNDLPADIISKFVARKNVQHIKKDPSKKELPSKKEPRKNQKDKSRFGSSKSSTSKLPGRPKLRTAKEVSSLYDNETDLDDNVMVDESDNEYE